MTTPRPTIAPQLVATMIETTPDRVRRRLDRSPDAAATWDWQAGDVWSIDTGGETVTLPLTHIVSVDDLRCTCLLSPRCFHVLACLTGLQVAIVDSAEAVAQDPVEQVEQDKPEEIIACDEPQRHAVSELVNCISQFLRVGVANAGVVIQSGLLRAVHQCRAEGLHRLAALGLKVLVGTTEFRARAPASDPVQLAEDVADVLETSQHLLGDKGVPSFWIGTARRQQFPIRPRKLHGLLAEPIITRSGFAGTAVYFLGEDDQIYSASDVRPGDAQLARNSYLGGIEIGAMVQPAKQLARGLYLGTELTASRDGRLGRGKGIKMVEQGQSTWQAEPIQQRFRQSLAEQWQSVYSQAALPVDARAAGWDFVFLQGDVLGAAGAELLFQSATDNCPLGLAIENESESLYFRENLRMLSHAPGLRLQLIGRVNLQQPSIVSPLAVAGRDGESPRGAEPHLEIPKPLAGRICLGFDEIQHHYLIQAQASPVVLNFHPVHAEGHDPLFSLRRRWLAMMLAGSAAQRPGHTNMLAAESATLNRFGWNTAAALLDSLSRSPLAGEPAAIDTFLATAVYLRHSRFEWARTRATWLD